MPAAPLRQSFAFPSRALVRASIGARLIRLALFFAHAHAAFLMAIMFVAFGAATPRWVRGQPAPYSRCILCVSPHTQPRHR